LRQSIVVASANLPSSRLTSAFPCPLEEIIGEQIPQVPHNHNSLQFFYPQPMYGTHVVVVAAVFLLPIQSLQLL
jgi:hypothetical protein